MRLFVHFCLLFICFEAISSTKKCRKIVNGCVFPFIYMGEEYCECITSFTGTKWCSKTANYDRDRKWALCKDECHFPFELQGQIFYKCVTVGYTKPWCSKTANFDEDKQFRVCKEKKTPRCQFPFIDLAGLTRYYCTPGNGGRPYCATTSSLKKEPFEWKYCQNECSFPFNYNGKQFTSCVEVTGKESWCATAKNFEEKGGWKYCNKEEKSRCWIDREQKQIPNNQIYKYSEGNVEIQLKCTNGHLTTKKANGRLKNKEGNNSNLPKMYVDVEKNQKKKFIVNEGYVNTIEMMRSNESTIATSTNLNDEVNNEILTTKLEKFQYNFTEQQIENTDFQINTNGSEINSTVLRSIQLEIMKSLFEPNSPYRLEENMMGDLIRELYDVVPNLNDKLDNITGCEDVELKNELYNTLLDEYFQLENGNSLLEELTHKFALKVNTEKLSVIFDNIKTINVSEIFRLLQPFDRVRRSADQEEKSKKFSFTSLFRKLMKKFKNRKFLKRFGKNEKKLNRTLIRSINRSPGADDKTKEEKQSIYKKVFGKLKKLLKGKKMMSLMGNFLKKKFGGGGNNGGIGNKLMGKLSGKDASNTDGNGISNGIMKKMKGSLTSLF
ncbi:hypothetical protein SNEBB_010539 [Seison nebaliae]|nr:hypothetical protein SNEBB_010539 [Seison nebaliae]